MHNINTITWDEFACRISAILMHAEDRTHITLIHNDESDENLKYIEYIIMNGGISCTLRNKDNPHSFSRSLPLLSSEYSSFSLQSIHILRDILQVSEPSSLTYYAWRAPEELEDGRYYSAEEVDELDEGEDPLEVDLGIEMASRRPELL